MRTGSVYTETVVHAAPERFASEAPYQVAIIELDGGEERVTARIEGTRVVIGDAVEETSGRDGIPFFRKIASQS